MVGMDGATVRTKRLTSGLWVATAVLGVAGIVLTIVVWGDLRPSDAYPNLGSGVASLVYATLGALIVRRARNVVGWILLTGSVAMAFIPAASAYGVLGIATSPSSVPNPVLAGALSDWSFRALVPALAFMFFFFPT